LLLEQLHGFSPRAWPALTAGLVLALAAPAFALGAPVPDRATLSRLDTVVQARMRDSNVPGAAVAVVADGRLVHARGFGTADDEGRRVTPQTPFVLASAGKSFTALAVMQLVDAGKVRLDAPVRAYVPEFRLADPGAANRITVRQVLQHTSGLPEGAGGPILKSAKDGTAAQAIAELRATTPASRPGAAFHYSNGNFVLAGLVIERASGASFAAYLRRHVFAPLDMTRSFTSQAAARAAGLAQGHRYVFGVREGYGPTFRTALQAAGYLATTVEDMSHYLTMWLEGGVYDGHRLVSERGMRTLLTPARPTTMGPWSDHATARYAMGWYVGGPWSERAVLHPGNSPDTTTMNVLLPKRGWGVVTLANAGNELPVPGYPAAIDRIARNAVDVLVGDRVESGTSLPAFYLRFDAVVLLLVAAAGAGLVRAVRRLRSGRGPCRRRLALTGVVVRAGVALVLLAVPGYGWAAAWTWVPDLLIAGVTFASLLVATAALRLATILRTRPPKAPYLQATGVSAESRVAVHG